MVEYIGGTPLLCIVIVAFAGAYLRAKTLCQAPLPILALPFSKKEQI